LYKSMDSETAREVVRVVVGIDLKFLDRNTGCRKSQG